jgi:hypothetical protein
MLPNLLTVVAENRRRELPDTRELAAEWIAANVPSGSTIAMTWLPYCPRLRLQQASAGILRSYAREDHLRQRLLEQWRGQPAYRLVNMEVWLKKPWVPEPLRAEVDLGDPESARVFRRAWLSLGQLKSKGVQYIVLPAAVYQRYLGSGEPPEHGAARFHYLKNRAYFEQFLKPDESKIAPQFSVEAGATSRGGSIRVFRII